MIVIEVEFKTGHVVFDSGKTADVRLKYGVNHVVYGGGVSDLMENHELVDFVDECMKRF